MKKRLYISGPISGHDEEDVRVSFSEAIIYLKSIFQDYEIINPLDNGLPYDAPWEKHMEIDLEILRTCDAIYFMNGWQHSKGSQREHDLAVELKMDRYYQVDSETTKYVNSLYKGVSA